MTTVELLVRFGTDAFLGSCAYLVLKTGINVATVRAHEKRICELSEVIARQNAEIDENRERIDALETIAFEGTVFDKSLRGTPGVVRVDPKATEQE